MPDLPQIKTQDRKTEDIKTEDLKTQDTRKEEMLARLVALNHARAAEEKSRHIR